MLLLTAAYLASGFYVVGSDEKAVVRRFGRMSPRQLGSGLHWDLPCPFVTVDRVNVAALHTVSIGAALPTSATLLPVSGERPVFALTGDENILRFRASLQFRVDSEAVKEYLFHHRELSAELQGLVEAALIEAAAQSGVDFVLSTGIGSLNSLLTERLRETAKKQKFGIEVDRVTLESVDPPAPVLADFLDVANARSEAAQAVQLARTFAEQRITAAAANALETISQARGESRSVVVAARASANRFERLVGELETLAKMGDANYSEQRERMARRLTRELYRDMVTAGVRTWVIGSEQPVDLQILRP